MLKDWKQLASVRPTWRKQLNNNGPKYFMENWLLQRESEKEKRHAKEAAKKVDRRSQSRPQNEEDAEETEGAEAEVWGAPLPMAHLMRETEPVYPLYTDDEGDEYGIFDSDEEDGEEAELTATTEIRQAALLVDETDDMPIVERQRNFQSKEWALPVPSRPVKRAAEMTTVTKDVNKETELDRGRGRSGNTSGDSSWKEKESRSRNNTNENGGRDGKQVTTSEASQEENHGGVRQIDEKSPRLASSGDRQGWIRRLRKETKGYQKEAPGDET